MLRWRQWIASILLGFTCPFMVLGQGTSGEFATSIPLLLESETQVDEAVYGDWLLQGARSALEAGFTDMAVSLGEQALSRTTTSDSEFEDAVRLVLSTGYLSQSRLEEASEQLSAISNQDFEEVVLRRAILLFLQGDLEASNSLVQSIDPSAMPAYERAWINLLSALMMLEEDELEEANARFSLAKRTAPSRILREQFELIRIRYEIAQGGVDDEEINALRGTVRSFAGVRSGFEAARLLAIALHQRGEIQEAIDFLSLKIQQVGVEESGLKPDLLLLIGLFAGEDSFQGRLALSQLVSEGGDRELQGIALTLLAQAPLRGEGQEEFLESIDQWLGQSLAHPLAERLYLYRAFLFADLTEFPEAERNALLVVNSYPDSTLVVPSLRLLAYISWSRIPSQYRTAADYLSRLRELLPEGSERTRVTRLMADCFFLNGDFPSAAEAYASVLRSGSLANREEIVFQQALSEIRSERLDRAIRVLDKNHQVEETANEMHWKAEWNLLQALKSAGRVEEAEVRLTSLLERDSLVDIQPSLASRLRWLQLRLWNETDRSAQVLEVIDTFLNEVQREGSGLEPELQRQLTAQLNLLKGEASYAEGLRDQGAEVFASLRETYPGSGPAILSFLIEARMSAASDGLVNAQQSLIQLADTFPESEFAPIALWEAAINAEQRGLNQYLQEAISLLERLISQYPDHRLVFYARLKQGDLSRRLNDFSTALLIYERLLARFPSHPERFRAELSRADCLFAQAGQNANRYEDASVIYERLILLPQTPFGVRIESGYKLSQTYFQQNLSRERRDTLWLIYERYIRNLSAERIATSEFKRARYWLARVLLDLADLSEKAGELKLATKLYQTHLNLNLPGRTLAQAQLNRLNNTLSL